MAIPLNDNIDTQANKPSDPRQYHSDNRLWADTTEAHNGITFKYVGLFVLINDGIGGAVVYWYKSDAGSASDLVPFQNSGFIPYVLGGYIFRLIKNSLNSQNNRTLQDGDWISNGVGLDGKFWRLAQFISGDPLTINNWTVHSKAS